MTSRGTIKITPSEADSGLVASFHPDSSAQLDTAAFDNMVENSALYTLVVLEEGDNTSKSTQEVSASVPGCSLRRSNLREEIGLSISPTGKLLSVSYRPIISPLAPKTCQKLKPLSEKPEVIFGRKGENDEELSAMPFKTTVSFESHKPMMAIPTVLPQQRPPPGLKWYRRNAKNSPSPLLGGSNVKHEGGGIPGVDDEPASGWKSSFLYRYWYIILPVAIMGLFGGGDEGGQAAPSGAAAAGASAGAVAAGGVSQATQRRGKRD
eukprot:CAMPEP_0172320806 /NCGR_PEP_ID=MMETSP1058-20130122/41498_1 /TAXON_ID=83371 /ORGANISM="Detonula confervacea, Strain CCMP 353" /LENGTH=264 /DNA_ID=CAMNT_0013036155 /DNA_START=140 /DNA_END=934 /DNA_ORIENTATION=+